MKKQALTKNGLRKTISSLRKEMDGKKPDIKLPSIREWLSPVPIEYCPECMSLKRKPNKECVNHNNYWIDKDEGLDRLVQDELQDSKKTKDELSKLMLKEGI